MEDYRAVVARNMAELRRGLHLTQAELAEKLQYSDKAVSKWERAESLPDVSVLKAFAELCGVTVDFLLTSHEAEEIKPAAENPLEKKLRDRKHVQITALVVCSILLLVTVIYVMLRLILPALGRVWLAYIVALPATAIVLVVFDALWNDGKLSFVLSSVLMWSILLTIFLFFLPFENIALIFVIGIPIEAVLVFAFRLARYQSRLRK